MNDWIPYSLRYLLEAVPLSEPHPLYSCGALQDVALLLAVVLPIWWVRAGWRADRDRAWVLRRATVLATLGFVAALLGVALWVQGWNFIVGIGEQVAAGSANSRELKFMMGISSPVPLIVGGVSGLLPLVSAIALLRGWRPPRRTSTPQLEAAR